jgi:hypothetical protein
MRTDGLPKTPAPYIRMANIAAEAESAGAYGFAARAWEAAARLARRETNRQWAEERCALCENAQRRGWGLNDDEEEK